MKHRWGEPVRPDLHHTLRTCTHCGLIKITRHEPQAHPPHWIEFERDGMPIRQAKTPVCEAA